MSSGIVTLFLRVGRLEMTEWVFLLWIFTAEGGKPTMQVIRTPNQEVCERVREQARKDGNAIYTNCFEREIPRKREMNEK